MGLPGRVLFLKDLDSGEEFPLRRDEYGALPTIDWEHHLRHHGFIHCVGDKFSSFSSSDSDKLYIIRTGSVDSHLLITLQGNIAAYTELFRSPTIDTLGNQVALCNNNDEFTATAETILFFEHGVIAVSADGIALTGATEFNAGSKDTGETRTRSEKILRPNTDYLLKFSAEQATAGIGIIKICVYEPEITPVKITS